MDLVLEPGARLRVRFTGQDRHCGYKIRVDGVGFHVDGLQRSTETTIAMPVGDIEVRWRGFDGVIAKSHRLTLAEGEEGAIAWDGKP